MIFLPFFICWPLSTISHFSDQSLIFLELGSVKLKSTGPMCALSMAEWVATSADLTHLGATAGRFLGLRSQITTFLDIVLTVVG